MPWRAHPYRLPLARPYAWAGGRQVERVGALVSFGRGWGEIAYPPGQQFSEDAVHAALRRLGDPQDVAMLAVDDPRIRCGAAAAWLDDAARKAGRSLAAELASAAGGQPRHTVRVNGLVAGDDVAQQVAQAAAQGIDVLKVKCGADRAQDVARVAAVRESAPHATLRLDANGAWSPDWALDHMDDLARFGIDYVEQPLPPEHEALLPPLAAHAPFDVAIDESATDAARIVALLGAAAASVVILKPQRLGGPDRLLDAMRAAEDAGARVVVTNSLETAVGVHVALHCASLLRRDEACGLATSGFLARDVAAAPCVVDGAMAVPSHGLGVDPVIRGAA